MSKSKPRYDHDHEGCTFLGQRGLADLYFCRQGGALPTVIARYSSEGSDYTSGMALADVQPDLHEARARARLAGLPA